MALKAVGFDIDGTLYPDYRAQVRSIPYFLRNARTVRAFTRVRKLMRQNAENPDIYSPGVSASDVEAKLFSLELGVDVDEARRIREIVIYKGWERCFRRVRPYAGVRESLERLKEAGLSLAALSDFPVGRKLEFFEIEDLFDVKLGFPESGRLKPRPEPFQIMADALGTEPSEILYIGNKVDYDVHGARNAGMRGALIVNAARRAPEGITAYTSYARMVEDVLSEVVK